MSTVLAFSVEGTGRACRGKGELLQLGQLPGGSAVSDGSLLHPPATLTGGMVPVTWQPWPEENPAVVLNTVSGALKDSCPHRYQEPSTCLCSLSMPHAAQGRLEGPCCHTLTACPPLHAGGWLLACSVSADSFQLEQPSELYDPIGPSWNDFNICHQAH